MEAKRFKVTLEDDCFTVIERGRDVQNGYHSPKSVVGKVTNFCLNACHGDITMDGG